MQLANGAALRVTAGPPLALGAEVDLAIRPERVTVVAPGARATENTIEARVTRITYQGAVTEVVTDAGGVRVLAFAGEPAAAGLAPGQIVRLELPADAFMVLT